jgi:hypothetical protein
MIKVDANASNGNDGAFLQVGMEPGDHPKMAKNVRKVLYILLERGNEDRRIVRIKGSSKDGASTPELVKEAQVRRILQDFREGVDAKTKRSGESGSPCLNPRP